MKKAIFFIFSFFIFSFFILPASAVTIISPIVEMACFPGDVQKGVVKVYNETDQEIVLKAIIKPFSAGSDSGQPTYSSLESDNSYLSWFELSQNELKLLPKQAAVIPFQATIPVSATPGGYYAVIFWEEKLQEGNTPLILNGRVGTLVFLRVNGDLNESLEIKEFGLKKGQLFTLGLPLNFFVKLENVGNVHLWPKGDIILKNIFGQTQKFELLSNKTAILPKSARQFETVFPGQTNAGYLSLALTELKGLFFGPIETKVIFTYGQSQETSEQSFVFWIMPWRAITIVFIGVFVFIFLFFINRKVNKLKKSLKKNPDEK